MNQNIICRVVLKKFMTCNYYMNIDGDFFREKNIEQLFFSSTRYLSGLKNTLSEIYFLDDYNNKKKSTLFFGYSCEFEKHFGIKSLFIENYDTFIKYTKNKFSNVKYIFTNNKTIENLLNYNDIKYIFFDCDFFEYIIFNPNFDNNNLFVIWLGEEYSLIKILHNLIYMHSNNRKNYTVHFINEINILNYVSYLPNNFNKIRFAHQADYIRVSVLYDYGGIYIDSDTIVMNNLFDLFKILEKNKGFFIKERSGKILNGVFGSIKKSPLLEKWKLIITNILNNKMHISWYDIGTNILMNFDAYEYDDFIFFEGKDNLHPLSDNGDISGNLLKEKYDNYKIIERDFQPLIILVSSVYENLKNKTEIEILNSNMPINYFINNSIMNSENKTYKNFCIL
jgi:hypothetical protein